MVLPKKISIVLIKTVMPKKIPVKPKKVRLFYFSLKKNVQPEIILFETIGIFRFSVPAAFFNFIIYLKVQFQIFSRLIPRFIRVQYFFGHTHHQFLVIPAHFFLCHRLFRKMQIFFSLYFNSCVIVTKSGIETKFANFSKQPPNF